MTMQLPASKETSREEAMRYLLTNEALADLTLEGLDGIKVRTHRCILASRSEVFEKMLYGSFSEASSSEIQIEYEGAVLRAVVEYIYTDNPKVLQCEVATMDSTTAQILVSLVAAATYFELGRLCNKTQSILLQAMNNRPALALPILAQCRQLGPSIPDEIGPRALAIIRRSIDSKTVIDSSHVATMDASVLEEIVSDDHVLLTELQLFKMIKLWVDAGSKHDQDRHAAGSDLTSHIRLERMDPCDISSWIEPSGLVSSERLLETFKIQAMEAKRNHGVLFELRRHMGVWMGSRTLLFSSMCGTHESDVLDYPVMSSGMYQWSILIEQECNVAWLGVAASQPVVDSSSWLGQQQGGWVYGSNGAACHAKLDNRRHTCIHPTYKTGSKVTFTLNLQNGEQGNGTLSAFVDDGPIFQLFSDMLSHLKDGTRGFLPAVSLCLPGRVQLLDIRKID